MFSFLSRHEKHRRNTKRKDKFLTSIVRSGCIDLRRYYSNQLVICKLFSLYVIRRFFLVFQQFFLFFSNSRGGKAQP